MLFVWRVLMNEVLLNRAIDFGPFGQDGGRMLSYSALILSA